MEWMEFIFSIILTLATCSTLSALKSPDSCLHGDFTPSGCLICVNKHHVKLWASFTLNTTRLESLMTSDKSEDQYQHVVLQTLSFCFGFRAERSVRETSGHYEHQLGHCEHGSLYLCALTHMFHVNHFAVKPSIDSYHHCEVQAVEKSITCCM